MTVYTEHHVVIKCPNYKANSQVKYFLLELPSCLIKR
jgi:hypothetical protein